MIPRLQPRSSLRRPSGIENIQPIDVNNNIDTSTHPDIREDSTSSVNGRPESYGRPTSTPTTNGVRLVSKENVHPLKEEQPLSPSRSTLEYDQGVNSPVPHDYGNQYKHLLMSYSSSTSNSLETDGCGMSCRDFSLTPPTAGSRPPLLVSAKRHGSEVRRQHNKRRRKRRRPSSSRSESERLHFASGKPVTEEGSDSDKEKERGALCLWKGDSANEPEGNYLPLLESSDEEVEQTDRIEEVVRAEHLKEARRNDNHRHDGSFSANRAPPPKGCLSNPRPKRPRSQTTQYKTPPKPTDEILKGVESRVQQARRVQFGIPSAVEYEVDRPPGHLTPMSQEVTTKRYSMDPRVPTREEDEITEETKQNNLILSAWEDQFSTVPEKKMRSHERSKRNGSSNKRNRRNRRSSSIFSPAGRISLASDFLNQHKPETIHNDNALSISSNSETIDTDCASLHSLNLMKLSEATNSQQISRGNSDPSASSIHEKRIWDSVADLGSINSKGAMELSPHSSSPKARKSVSRAVANNTTHVGHSTKLEDKSTPPHGVKFDTINAVGAAFHHESPNRQLSARKYNPIGDPSVSCCEGVKRGKSTISLSTELIDTPRSDQKWDFPDLLRNLSSWREKEALTAQRLLTSLDPYIQYSLACCISDISDQLMPVVTAKSAFPQSSSKQINSVLPNQDILTNWKQTEINTIKVLTNQMHQFRLEIENLISHAMGSWSKIPQSRKEVEEEISKLETDILKINSSVDLIEASMAPFSCLSCQATAQIGIYGFYFQQFRDDRLLELEYMHAVFNVKTRVVVDINSSSGLSIEYIDDLSNEEQNSIFDFHRTYINMIQRGKVPFEDNHGELQGSLLRLGQIFGKLDHLALALNEINDTQNVDVTIALPQIRLSFPPKDGSMLLKLDLASFQITVVSVSTGEVDFKIKHPNFLSSIRCHTFQQSLERLVAQFSAILGRQDLCQINGT